MKTIYLVRHGKAVTRDIELPDFKRHLIDQGKNDLMKVAWKMKKDGIKPSLIISSPAPRAMQTARIFAKQLNYGKRTIRKRKTLYDQANGAILQVLQEIKETIDNCMICGHNPSIEEFARFLVKDFSERVPTSAVIGIKADVTSWNDISENCGKVTLFYTHKSVQKLYEKKFLKEELEKNIADAIGTVIKDADENTAEKIKKSVKEISKKLAKKFVKKLQEPKKKN